MLGVFLVVMFSFRSFAIPMIVMVPIEAAIFLNMAMPYLAGIPYGVYGYIIVKVHPAGSRWIIPFCSPTIMCPGKSSPVEEGSVYSGTDAVLSFLFFYFGNHYFIGWIYHSFHIDYSAAHIGTRAIDWIWDAVRSVILVLITVLPAFLVLF